MRRIPAARYIGIDVDPVLLHLARDVGASFPVDRFDVIDCDVSDGRWLDHVSAGEVDAVCSSTALHWLNDSALARTLALAHRALAGGGVLLNADHLGFDSAAFDGLARWIADRDETSARDAGALDWSAWWERARADPVLGPLCSARDLVFPPVGDRDADDAGRPPLREFTDAVRAAGFGAVDSVWQRFDDRIVMAIKDRHLTR